MLMRLQDNMLTLSHLFMCSFHASSCLTTSLQPYKHPILHSYLGCLLSDRGRYCSSAVICVRDMARELDSVQYSGSPAALIWHAESDMACQKLDSVQCLRYGTLKRLCAVLQFLKFGCLGGPSA